MGGDRGNSKSTIGLPPSNSEKDWCYDGAAYDEQIVGVSPGG